MLGLGFDKFSASCVSSGIHVGEMKGILLLENRSDQVLHRLRLGTCQAMASARQCGIHPCAEGLRQVSLAHDGVEVKGIRGVLLGGQLHRRLELGGVGSGQADNRRGTRGKHGKAQKLPEALLQLKSSSDANGGVGIEEIWARGGGVEIADDVNRLKVR